MEALSKSVYMRSGGGTLGAPVHGTHSVDIDVIARDVREPFRGVAFPPQPFKPAFPEVSVPGSPEALPYPILRRMSRPR